MATKDRSDSRRPANLGGRPSALNAEHIAALHDIVAEHAQASLAEIAGELERRRGVHVCEATIRRALRPEGIVRLKAKRRVYPTVDKGPKRYGYTATHRRGDVRSYGTNLTDAKWDLVLKDEPCVKAYAKKVQRGRTQPR
jgi:putative transposase